MLSSIIHNIFGISPSIEVFFKKLYWHHIRILHRFKPLASPSANVKNTESFNHIIEIMKLNGIGLGKLLIVHSSFRALKQFGKSPDQIIDVLLELLGEEGTLAMPAFRRFEEEPDVYNILNTNIKNIKCTYDLELTPIWTGILPLTLSRRKEAVISRFPINPLVAIGKLAKQMMEKNLLGDVHLPHGENSSWKFCLDNQAIIVGLGIDLAHSLTILRTYEECNFSSWPVKDWYNKRLFNIIDKNFVTSISVLDRKSFWGMLYLPQINMRKDLINNKILKTYKVNGFPVEILESKKLFEFFREKNELRKCYPYLIPKKHLNL